MYTPRQPSSSLTPAQSSFDPSTGIRVVIQPSQSSYFAGEPFSCTVTFTNTRCAVPSSRVRSYSASFNPGHKRAAHSVSSAPLARPPTSPGTPKTAQPFLASQNKDADTKDRVSRKGLIGKPAVLEKKRRNVTRSLSVDVTPQDIIKRRADQTLPHPPAVPRPQSERSSPASPHASSPLARERVDNLPSSHPHARKHSVASDDMTSQTVSFLSPYPPPTSMTASASSFQVSLDPITENSTNYQSPTLSENPSSLDVTQPPPPSQGPYGRRSSALGLGLPLAVPPNTRAKSTGGPPPHTAFSTSFSLPSTELLLYAYVQLSGTLSVDPAFMPTSSEFLDLRDVLRKKAVVGGGSLDIGSGTHQRRANGGFFGFLSSSNTTSKVASRISAPNGIATAASATGEDEDEAIPTLETQPSMLAIDLTLAAGESRSYSYTLDLPANLPPTFKGRALRFSYQLVVGACRASTPFVSASSPGLVSPLRVGLPVMSGDSERRRSRVMQVPIRVYNHVAVGHAPRPYDLLWPVARRQEKTAIGRIDEVKGDKFAVKPAKPTGSLTSVQSYAHRLLCGEGELELEPPTDESGDGGALSGCREAVEITTRNPKKESYDVRKDGDRVAVLTFVKSAYRLGETVLGIVELNEGHCRSRVLKLSAMLEAHESLTWPGGPVRRVHAEHHSSLVSDMRRVAFALDIPSDASPAFEVNQGPNGRAGGLEWKVRLCLLVSVATGPGSVKGKGRAAELRGLVRDGPAGEWGMSWRASECLAPMERVRPPLLDPQHSKASTSWTAAIFNAFASATYHDADEQEDDDEEDDSEWAEMSAETVECVVPIRVFAGNTAFRAVEVMFEV